MKNKLLTALLSAFIALGIWLYVVTVVSPNSDKHYYNIPVTLQSEALLQDRGLMITATQTPTVSLHLEGNRIDLNKLSSSNISVTADVSKIYEAGTHKLTYTVTYPGDIASNSITELSKTPSTVTVQVEERVSKTVPVEILYTGNLSEDFMADKENKELDFEKVNLAGPKSVMDQITKAQIEVDLDGRVESFTEQFTYTLCNAEGEPVDAALVTTDVKSVTLTLKILRVKEIDLTVSIIYGGGATETTAQVDIEPKTIRISGSDNLLEGLDSLELGTINLGEILSDETLLFPIKLPGGITNETGVAEAAVDVRFLDLEMTMLTVTDIRAVNVPAGLEVELITKALELQIRGPSDRLQDLQASDVTVTVDCSEAKVGTEKLKVEIIINDPEIGAVGSYTVSATVRESGNKGA